MSTTGGAFEGEPGEDFDLPEVPEAEDVPPLKAALHAFQEAGLPSPPIPEPMVERLRVLEHGAFGTRDLPLSLYSVEYYLEEVARGRPGDYMAFGHAGYGVSNWAMHYYLVLGPLALFLQIPWGGAYTDEDAAVEAMTAAFGGVEELVPAAEAARAEGRLGPGERVVVVDSPRFGRSWCRVPAGGAEAPAWRDAPNALLSALQALQG